MKNEIYFEVTPTLGDVDNDGYKEVFFGLDNGTVIGLDVINGGGDVEQKWYYTVDSKSGYRGVISTITIEDVDLDGTNEIIFTDAKNIAGWNGEVYVTNAPSAGGQLNLEDKESIDIGGEGAASIANIDSDDYSEIIVPTYYGVYVFDYDGNTLTKKWNNSDGRIDNSIVVYDYDRDNKYELIYSTSSATCLAGETCLNKTYMRDALTGNNEANSPISYNYVTRTTPAIANLDSEKIIKGEVLREN